MGNIVVEIQVKQGTGTLGEADFTYNPSTFICTRGDVIQWKCPQGPFALHFGERPLLGKVVIRSGAEKDRVYRTQQFTVGKKPGTLDDLEAGAIQRGMHKYSVAVNLDATEGDAVGLQEGVYIDACPSGGYEC